MTVQLKGCFRRQDGRYIARWDNPCWDPEDSASNQYIEACWEPVGGKWVLVSSDPVGDCDAPVGCVAVEDGHSVPVLPFDEYADYRDLLEFCCGQSASSDSDDSASGDSGSGSGSGDSGSGDSTSGDSDSGSGDSTSGDSGSGSVDSSGDSDSGSSIDSGRSSASSSAD